MVEDSTLSMELNELKRKSSYNEELESFSQLISTAFPQASGLMNDDK